MDKLLEAGVNVQAAIDATQSLTPQATAEGAAILQAVRYLADAVSLMLAEMRERSGAQDQQA